MQFKIAGGEPIGSQLPDKPAGLKPYALGPGQGWGVCPGDVFTVAAQVTVTTTGVIDWSQAGLFQFLLSGTSVFAPSFANAVVGQQVIILLKQPASAGPSTLSTSNMGTFILAGTAAGTVSLSSAANAVDILRVKCLAPGSFIATFN